MEFRPHLSPVFGEDERKTLLGLLNGQLIRQLAQLAAFWAVPVATVRASFSAYKQATVEVRHILTEHLEEWFLSGRNSDGGEVPSDRKLRSGSQLLATISDYASIVRTNFALNEVTGLPIAYLDSLRWGPGSLAESWPLEEDPVTHAEYEAVRVLASIMLCEYCRTEIAKCAWCEAYFFLPPRGNEEQRRAYTNGTFCSTAHNRNFTATRRKRQVREGIQSKKIEWAANELRRLPWQDAWYDDTAVKARMASGVNRHPEIRRDPRQKIDTNFIHLHRVKIQQLVTSEIGI